jgi:hypothetical protein
MRSVFIAVIFTSTVIKYDAMDFISMEPLEFPMDNEQGCVRYLLAKSASGMTLQQN